MNAAKYNELKRKEERVICQLATTVSFIHQGMYKQAIMELEHGRRQLVELTNELHAEDVPRPG